MQVRTAVALLALLVGCGGAGGTYRKRGLDLAAEGRLAEAISELRLAVAADPRDAVSHAVLGRLEAKAGRPGAAIRELDAAEKLGNKRVRAQLAALLVRRAQALGRIGLRGRWRWFERARELDPGSVTSVELERREALTDGGIALWAAGDERGAADLWRRAPSAVGEALAHPQDMAPLVLRETVARLRAVAGDDAARRLDPAAVLDCGGGFSGLDRPECLPPLEHDARRGLEAPPVLPPPGELRGERPATPEAVALVLALSLEAWLWGERDVWIDEDVASFVERERAGRDVDEFPIWIRPTLRRLAGEPAKSGGGESIPPYGKLVLAIETRDVDRLDDSLLSLLARAELGDERALARAAKSPEGKRALLRRHEVAFLLEDPEVKAAVRRWWSIVRQRPDAEPIVARWRRQAGDAAVDLALAGSPARPARGTRALPGTPAGAPGCDVPLAPYRAIAAAYVREPAVADRLARDFVDAEPAAHCRATAMAELFLDAGDPARARAYAEELVAEDPTDEGSWILGLRAALHDPPRAEILLQQAEYWSKFRGRASILATRWLLDAGQPLPALSAARQALALATPPRRWTAFEALIDAAAAAHRDAASVLTTYFAELPSRLKPEARRRLHLDPPLVAPTSRSDTEQLLIDLLPR